MRTTGRFAPSPTGPLHLGNLRTALVSWLAARAAGGRWLVRMEDLDRVTSSPEHESGQLAALAALGLHWDGPVWRQSERFAEYRLAIAALASEGRVYPCYCTRREIRDAAQAPHGALPEGAYPGTCRELDAAGRARRERDGRRPALRLRTDGEVVEVDDLVAGHYRGAVDDVVLQRNDGVPAYNLAVVVDDAAQGVTLVVRGDDLLESTPRQVLLQRLLGLPTPQYAHVPLVLGPDGARLAKRHGVIVPTAAPAATLVLLGRSLGLAPAEGTVDDHLARWVATFRLDGLPRRPWTVEPTDV
jgi:glutamyl-tRNA synthetase